MYYPKAQQHREAIANVIKPFTDYTGMPGGTVLLSDVLYSQYHVEDFSYNNDEFFETILLFFKNSVVPHKLEVYKAGMSLTLLSWVREILLLKSDWNQFIENLWLHDLSKFCAAEAPGYAMYDRKTGHGKLNFELAWHHHKMHNPHHPEYWMNPNRSGELEPLVMPAMYILEMLADWIGAGKTYGATLEEWLPQNLSKFYFGPSITLVQEILANYGIETHRHGKVLSIHPNLA